jgi:hypothetical protein
MPVGTPVKAPHAGQLAVYQGGSLWQANITHPSGWKSELLHVSGFAGGNRSVSQGEVVAYSGGQKGAPGAGTSSGPHLHWTLKNATGTQVDPLLHLAGAALTPIPSEDDMIIFSAMTNSADGLIKANYKYMQAADGPLRAFSNLEYSAWLYTHPSTIEISYFGDDIRQLVKIVGLREQGAPQGLSYSNGAIANDGRLTGNIIY